MSVYGDGMCRVTGIRYDISVMRLHIEAHMNQAYYDMPLLNQHLADGIERCENVTAIL